MGKKEVWILFCRLLEHGVRDILIDYVIESFRHAVYTIQDVDMRTVGTEYFIAGLWGTLTSFFFFII